MLYFQVVKKGPDTKKWLIEKERKMYEIFSIHIIILVIGNYMCYDVPIYTKMYQEQGILIVYQEIHISYNITAGQLLAPAVDFGLQLKHTCWPFWDQYKKFEE